MAAHAGHTAETLRRAADPRSHASARGAGSPWAAKKHRGAGKTRIFHASLSWRVCDV